jgi:hypothetical protein
MNATSQEHRGSPWGMAVGVTGVLMLAACASTPAPTASLQAAHQAISNAERAEAGHYAPLELNEGVPSSRPPTPPLRSGKLAEESNFEAQLASAKTADLKAKAVNAEMSQSTGTLIEEMQRKSGEKP